MENGRFGEPVSHLFLKDRPAQRQTGAGGKTAPDAWLQKNHIAMQGQAGFGTTVAQTPAGIF